MRLEGISPGDLIKASIGGRSIYGEVLEIREGTVYFEPISRGASWRHARAHQVVKHWRLAGSPRHRAAQPREQLSLQLTD